MLHTFWSVKGGSGVTVTCAAFAAIQARRRGGATLVDLRGDLPAALGLAEPVGPGVRDWLAASDGSPEALSRLELDVGAGLTLIPAGRSIEWHADRVGELCEVLTDRGGPVIVDAGVLASSASGTPPSSGLDGLGHALAEAGRSTMIVRPCYLALRRAMNHAARSDDVMLVVDPGRALDRRDVATVLRRPVVAAVEVDPAIARSVDAGMLLNRSLRRFERSLRGVR